MKEMLVDYEVVSMIDINNIVEEVKKVIKKWKQQHIEQLVFHFSGKGEIIESLR